MPLNKQQLLQENNTNFPNNNSQLITPELLRQFNADMIDSMQLTQSMSEYAVLNGGNTFTGNQTITGNLNVTGVISASVLYVQTETASVIYSSGSNQFGDALNDTQILSGSVLIVGSGSINGQRILTTADTGSISFGTGSLVTTASFNAYTQSTNQRLTSLETNSASVNVSISNLNQTTASLNTSVTALNQFTQSQQALNGTFATTGSNTFTGNQIIDRASKLYTNGVYWTDMTAGYNNLEIINQGGGNLDFASLNGGRMRVVNTPLILTGSTLSSNSDISTSANIYAANLTGSSANLTSLNQFTASQQLLNSTFATTGSNTFTGQQTLQNSLVIEESGNPLVYTQMNQSGIDGKLYISQAGATGVKFDNVNVQMNELTASLQQGYVWAGGAGNISTLVATSSFFASGSGPTDISALNAFTASQLTINTGYNTFTQSANASISSLNAATSSYVTETESGSFLITASFDNGTRNLTFTKGNNTTFNVNIPDVSGSTLPTGVISGSAQISALGFVSSSVTASSLITASAAGSTITFTKGDNTQFSVTVATGSVTFAETASLATNALDIIVNVKNTTGATINKGTVVRIIGATGDNPLIGTASWTNDPNSANTLGFVVSNIANDGFGRVMTQGTLLSVNTDPALGYAAGQLVYLSSSGQFTNVKPDAPFHEVRLGQVLRAQQNNGSIYVLVQNGYELDELHDVDINTGSLANNDLLAWDSASQQWTNKTVSGVGATTTSSFNSYTSSTNSRLTNIESTTASLLIETQNLELFSASALISINSLNGKTGSYATTGSNTFTGQQILSNTGNLQFPLQIISGGISVNDPTADWMIFSTQANGGLRRSNNADLEVLAQSGSLNVINSAGRVFVSGSTTTVIAGVDFIPFSSSLMSSITQLNVSSASQQISINSLNAATASYVTETESGSFLITASFSGNTLTFTKGNNTTFGVVIPDVSGSTINTGSFATTGSNAFFGTNSFSGAVSFTGSAPSILSSSFSGSLITNLTDIYTDIPAVQQIVTLTSASYAALASGSLTNPNTLYIVSGSLSGSGGGTTDITSLNAFTASQYVSNSFFATTGSNTFNGSQTINVLSSGNITVNGNTTSQQLVVEPTATETRLIVKHNDKALLRFNSSGQTLNQIYDITIDGASNTGSLYIGTADQAFTYAKYSDNGLTTLYNKVDLSGSLNITGSISASLPQGFVLVGDASNRTALVATSSFGGGTTINTGSFATTGSNSFNGDQNITGSVRISQLLNFGTASLGASIQSLDSGTGLGNTGLQINAGESGSFSMRTLYGGGVGEATMEAYDTWPTYTKGGKVDVKSQGGVDIFGYNGDVNISGSNTLIQGVNFISFSASLAGGPGAISVQDEGTILGNATSFNFNGAGVTATLSAGTASITIPGGGGSIDTGSFATTGSNTFTGDQTFIDNAGNFFTISDVSGSMMLVGKSYTSASAHLSSSVPSPSGSHVNIIWKTNNNTADTIISGSNNIFPNPQAPTAGFKRYLTQQNIFLGTQLPLVSGSMQFSPTISSNIGGIMTLRGPVSASLMSINNNISANGQISFGQSAVLHAQGLINQSAISQNFVAGALSIVANQSNINSLTNLTQNNINGVATLNLSSSAVIFAQNSINDGNFTFTNQFSSGAVGTGQSTISANTIGGSGNTFYVTGSQTVASPIGAGMQNNILLGNNNTIFVNSAESRVSGTTIYHQAAATGLIGNRLIVTGSSNINGDTNSYGSVFVGRWNAVDGIRNKTSDIIFAVGTGTSGTRKTGFLIDSGSNTFVEGTFNVSGSAAFNGNVNITGSLLVNGATISTVGFATTGSNSFNGNQRITGSLTMSGSIITVDRSGNDTNLYLGLNALGMGFAGAQPLAEGNTIAIAIGNGAMRFASGSSQNVAIGNNALLITTGSKNFAMGSEALSSNTLGSSNIAIGTSALTKNTTGQSNTAIGDSAGFNTSGSQNTFIGQYSGYNITGSNNTIIGSYQGSAGQVLNNNIVLADGQQNVKAQYSGSAWSFQDEIKLNKGSNKPSDIVNTDSSGTVTVSNSLVTPSSIILVTVQNREDAPSVYPAVVGNKGTGTFDIFVNWAGVSEVAYLIINPTA